MFGISLPEILVVLAVMLMVLGPSRLPEAARQFGKMMAFFRKNSEDLRREFYQTLYTPAQEARKGIEEVRRELRTEDVKKPEQPALSEESSGLKEGSSPAEGSSND